MTRVFSATIYLALFILLPNLSQAMESSNPFEEARVSGSLRTGYWQSDRTLSDETGVSTASVWLRAEPDLSDNSWMVFDGRLGKNSYQPDNNTYNWYKNNESDLREAYLELRTQNIDFKLGKQIITWGRADKINPTDNLSPHDFTLLTPKTADQKSGTMAAKSSYYFDSDSLTLIWLINFNPNQLPLPTTNPMLQYIEHTPTNTRKQGAIKFNHIGQNLDWSISYFNGFDLNPDLNLESFSPTSATIGLQHHRIRVIGADASTTIGLYGLRAESAYIFTEDTRGTDPTIKNPFFSLVAGGDRTFFDSFNINFQYLIRITSKYHNAEDTPDPILREVAIQQAILNNELDRIVQGVSARINDKWLSDTLTAEIAGVYTFPRHGYFINSNISYALTDDWKFIAGADYFGGDDQTFYGRLKKNSGYYIQLQYGF